MRVQMLIAFLLAAGCSGDDSFDVEGIPYYLDLQVRQYDSGAEFLACAYRYHLCEPAGTFEVEHGGQIVALETIVGSERYGGWLESVSAEELYRFTWSGAGEQSPVTAEVMVPEEFTISAPSPGSTLSAAGPWTIEWTAGNPDGFIAWGYHAECLESTHDDFFHVVRDSGHVEIEPDQVPFVGPCAAELWLERLARGRTSSAQANIIATQARGVPVGIAP